MKQQELQKLQMVPVPCATNTYSPISNMVIHDTIVKEAKTNGFDITDMFVKTRNGRNCITMYSLQDKLASYQDPEIGIRVAFKNSYDRTMSFGFALGSEVFICSNGMVSGEYTIKKQHRMKEVEEYAKELICQYFGNVRGEHEKNLIFAQELKKHDVSRDDAARIVGELFINNKIINQSQLREMTNQMFTSEKFSNFSDNDFISGWDLYNHGTEALKTSANGNLFTKHIGYSNYFRGVFGIGD